MTEKIVCSNMFLDTNVKQGFPPNLMSSFQLCPFVFTLEDFLVQLTKKYTIPYTDVLIPDFRLLCIQQAIYIWPYISSHIIVEKY